MFAPDRLKKGYLSQELETLRTEVQDYLNGVAAHLADEGRDVHVETRVGDAVRVIVDASREQGAALVVMTTHGH